MGCGCRKNRTVTTNINSTMSGGYEVYRNGVPTGRKFTSLISAQTYAARIGGTVESIA
jgi:hypothetical protein